MSKSKGPSSNITRNELASFLKNHEQIKKFENLFKTEDEIIDIDIGGLEIAPYPQNNYGSSVDYVSFNSSPSNFSRYKSLFWNRQSETVNAGIGNGVYQTIGMDNFALVSNNTGSTIPIGSVVGFSGIGPNNTLSIVKYIANNSQVNVNILGVMVHSIPSDGSIGYCKLLGTVSNLDTTGSSVLETWNVGDILYANPFTAGHLTNVIPDPNNRMVQMGVVIDVDSSEGSIFIRPVVENLRYYGTFLRTSNQTATSTNTQQLITFDTSVLANGISIGTPASRIIIPETGLYHVYCGLVFANSSASTKTGSIWINKNGTPIPYSCVSFTQQSAGDKRSSALNRNISFIKNDYLEMAFSVTNAGLTLSATPASGPAPDGPSVALTITQIQQ